MTKYRFADAFVRCLASASLVCGACSSSGSGGKSDIVDSDASDAQAAADDAAPDVDLSTDGSFDVPELPIDGACANGRTLCGLGCIDLTTDVENCGACDNACAFGASCAASACVCDQPGDIVCAGTCIDVKDDAFNCGACDKQCAIDCAGSACLGAEDLASGAGHVCGRITDGTVRCWGLGSDGQLGYSPSSSCDIPGSVPLSCELGPKPVTGLTGVAQVAASFRASYAMGSDGTVRAWGANTRGQLGNGTTTPSSVPVLVSGLSSVVEIEANGDHACARLANGTLKCWGENGAGQLGYASPGGFSSTPTFLAGIASVAQVAVGFAHTCAVRTDGRALCWGLNDHGQLGIGDRSPHPTPTLLALTGISKISAGVHHTCALLANGAVQCWGEARYGALGDGSDATNFGDVLAPGGVGLSNVVALAAGWTHTCAVTGDGKTWCWGSTSLDGVGSPLGFDAPATCVTDTGKAFRCARAPAQVNLAMLATQVAGGSSHTCVRSSAGSVVCWGWNAAGQVGIGTKSVEELPSSVVW